MCALRARYAELSRDGAPRNAQDAREIRIILNYTLPIL
jgi:hypothetical protein